MPLASLPTRTAAFLLACALALPALAPPAAADGEVLPPRPIDRRFPQGQFCALPVDIEFTAPGATVRIVFEAKRFVLDPNDNSYHWTEQHLDNVAVSAAADYDANFGPPPDGSNSQNCYIGDPAPTPYFYDNRAGLALPLLERFDTDPAARGWDLGRGAAFDAFYGAPRNVEFETDYTGGSLALGADDPAPQGDEVATTEITVNGLTAGSNYNLSAWWSVGHVIFGNEEPMLTITIFAPESTPVVRRSWGAVKRSWR